MASLGFRRATIVSSSGAPNIPSTPAVQKNLQIAENAKVVYDTRKHLNNLTEALHYIVKANKNREKAGKDYAECIKQYSNFLKELEVASPLGKCLASLSNCQSLIEESNAKLDTYLTDEFTVHIKNHIKTDIEPALEAKKRYDSIATSFENQTAALNDAKKKNKGTKKAQDEYQLTKQAYEQAELDALNKLQDTKQKNVYLMLDDICAYVDNYKEYLLTCQMAIERMEMQLKELRTVSSSLKSDYETTVAKRPVLHVQSIKDQKTGVFGVTLAEVFSRENSFHIGLPSFLKPIFIYIFQNCLELEGIFRVSPNKAELKAFKVSIDQGNTPDFSGVSDPHVVSGLLGLWLREMPEPLCTFELYDKFLAQKNEQGEKLVNNIKGIVNQLAPSNKTVLQHLMHLLANVAQFSEVNKMTAANLAIVFGPTILYSTEPDPLSFESVNKIVETMIVHYEDIFGEPIASDKYHRRPTSTVSSPIALPEVRPRRNSITNSQEKPAPVAAESSIYATVRVNKAKSPRSGAQIGIRSLAASFFDPLRSSGGSSAPAPVVEKEKEKDEVDTTLLGTSPPAESNQVKRRPPSTRPPPPPVEDQDKRKLQSALISNELASQLNASLALKLQQDMEGGQTQ